MTSAGMVIQHGQLINLTAPYWAALVTGAIFAGFHIVLCWKKGADDDGGKR